MDDFLLTMQVTVAGHHYERKTLAFQVLRYAILIMVTTPSLVAKEETKLPQGTDTLLGCEVPCPHAGANQALLTLSAPSKVTTLPPMFS